MRVRCKTWGNQQTGTMNMNNHDSNEGKKSAMTTLNKDSFFDVSD